MSDTDDFGQFPRVHPRHVMLIRARGDLLRFKLDWTKKYDLSTSEVYFLFAEEMLQEASYCVRAERKTRKKWREPDAE